jgi:hypothetical protein
MKKTVAFLTVVLLLAGCSFLCKFSPEQRANASSTLHSLQAGYQVMVVVLQQAPRPEVQIAVALTDAALDQAGKLLDKYCPTAQELAILEATAKGAEEARKVAGLP